MKCEYANVSADYHKCPYCDKITWNARKEELCIASPCHACYRNPPMKGVKK